MRTIRIEKEFPADDEAFLVVATVTPGLPETLLDPPEPPDVFIEEIIPDPGMRIDLDAFIESMGGEDYIKQAILEDASEMMEARHAV